MRDKTKEKKEAFGALDEFKKAGLFDGLKKFNDNEELEDKQYVKKLAPWHYHVIEDLLKGATLDETKDKYECSLSAVTKIWRSDAGVLAAQRILSNYNVKAFRDQLKQLNGLCYTNLKKFLDPKTSTLEDKVLAKLTIDVLKLNGIAEPTEHKFEFEHKFKRIADAIAEAERIVETKIIDITNDAVVEVALNSE